MNSKDPHAEKYERCVLCGAITTIPISTPVDQRENYEIGMGQLCADCASTLKSKTEQAHTLSYEQLVLAVESSRQEPPAP